MVEVVSDSVLQQGPVGVWAHVQHLAGIGM